MVHVVAGALHSGAAEVVSQDAAQLDKISLIRVAVMAHR
jgi:hypothetical protein